MTARPEQIAGEDDTLRAIEERLDGLPATSTIVRAVLAHWPEHAKYLMRSFSARDANQLEMTEILAAAALVLEGNRLAELASNYRWTCDRLREEELHFHRSGAYRFSTFEDANREVYSNDAYMEHYVDGLLLSQILWFNHVGSCDFFFREAQTKVRTGARYLEIGPGHGLMTYLAMRDFGVESAVVWDLSAVSVEHTKAALSKLGFDNVTCEVRDATDQEGPDQAFDFIVMSEVLEHIEDPSPVVARLRDLISEDGVIFVNVPINSPSPDHIYLMRTPEEARALLTENGFEIVSEAMFATQGTALDRALRNSVSVSVNMFARKV
jgi:2-polyprenyl-3-methyl-5-hydroxy-6-metoxy-1,4-benzoquinol methylase